MTRPHISLLQTRKDAGATAANDLSYDSQHSIKSYLLIRQAVRVSKAEGSLQYSRFEVARQKLKMMGIPNATEKTRTSSQTSPSRTHCIFDANASLEQTVYQPSNPISH